MSLSLSAAPSRLSLFAGLLPALARQSGPSSSVASSSSSSSSSLPAPAPVQVDSTPSSFGGASLWRTLQDLMPSIVLAVPKKQTSKRAKRMRSMPKFLKPKIHINHCQACGQVKLHAHLCFHCFSTIRRDAKNEKRAVDLLAAHGKARDGSPLPIPAPDAKVVVGQDGKVINVPLDRPKNYLETGNPKEQVGAVTREQVLHGKPFYPRI